MPSSPIYRMKSSYLSVILTPLSCWNPLYPCHQQQCRNGCLLYQQRMDQLRESTKTFMGKGKWTVCCLQNPLWLYVNKYLAGIKLKWMPKRKAIKCIFLQKELHHQANSSLQLYVKESVQMQVLFCSHHHFSCTVHRIFQSRAFFFQNF